jgi:signal transduction histidine kinase/HAMP domain-containing protein/ActR/RegA family two-component response regulator
MIGLSSLRVRLAGTVFVAVAPALALMYFAHLSWMGFAAGLLALIAAWFGGELFILRQLRILSASARRWASGDFSARTGLQDIKTEIGELARAFDRMADSVANRTRERERTEKTLLTRSFQQTVVGALGQFAMVSSDYSALLNQVVMLVAQTLEIEYSSVLELQPDGNTLVLRAGTGWPDGVVGKAMVRAEPTTQAGFTLTAGEPVVVPDLRMEMRFHGAPFLIENGVISSVTVAIATNEATFGVLGAHTTHARTFTEDEVHFLLSIGHVLAMAVQRIRSESEMQKLASFAQLNPNPAIELTDEGRVTYSNTAARDLANSLGAEDPELLLPPNSSEVIDACVVCRKSAENVESQRNGRTLSWSFHPVPGAPLVHAYFEDITERLSLEAQLRQAQKMESVGQLAAGVAHDFNNMLTVIQGHAGMLQASKTLEQRAVTSAQAIFYAAERAAGLTRQLLMFSRKNVMQPALLDLREVMGNMSKMMQRLLGETVLLQFVPPTEVPLVKGDPGMLEQVIMNLAVNARDAMPRGGILTINLFVVEIDAAGAREHPEARPGIFVCLRVSDTGCGMDTATMARIFEPFFTTKEVGKGTGLGLATVYGIVKRHEGWIEVASQVARGTTFDIFLPASTAPMATRPKQQAQTSQTEGGQETIMVVEDEPVLREMAVEILKDCGYQVMQARSGADALQVLADHPNGLDLLLTDVVMPDGISGVDLALKLRTSRPALKIVFASGYSVEDLDTDFIRHGSASFLQKPYTHYSLAKMVRESLDR